MIQKSIMAGVALCILAGCSVPARMQTRQEWQENTSRRFPGKTAEEVLVAGKDVLRLAGAKDFPPVPQPNRMVASRRWSKNLGFAAGFDTWNFDLTAVPEEGGTVATLVIVGSSKPMAPRVADTPSAGDDGGPGGGVTMPPANNGHGWPFAPAYDLFWRRMEAVLYDRDWVSCSYYLADPSRPIFHSVTVDPLCFNAKDNLPPGAVVSQAEQTYREGTREGATVAVQKVPVE
jgi:hypothetical protein